MTLLLKKYVNTVLIIMTVPLILFLSCLLLLLPLVAFTVSLCAFLFLQAHRQLIQELDGNSSFLLLEHAQHNQDSFRLHRAAFYSQLKSKVYNIILAKATAPIATHTHSTLPLTNNPLPSLQVSCSPAPPSMCEAFTSSFSF
jgi:hypothetical protein